MAHINNRSPFASEQFAFPDTDGQEISLLVIAATFEENTSRLMEPTIPQPPVRAADKCFGDPAFSSVRYEADIALNKPFIDVIVNGCAYAPKGRRARSVEVELHIGDIHKKLLVYGDRKRLFFPLGGATSKAEPFLTMPIIYERSYGGTDDLDPDPKKHRVYRWNPIGLGFRGVQSHDPHILTHVPNIEYAGSISNSVKMGTAGFGVIGRGWSPRLEFAGKYDQKWLDTQWPILPADFDPQHYQSAPADQQSRTIRGGEEVLLLNMVPDGIWRFSLPKMNVPLRLHFADREIDVVPRLDTVIIEPDLRRVTLSCRVGMLVERNRAPLSEIVLGRVDKFVS
jgi:hypothetical protein